MLACVVTALVMAGGCGEQDRKNAAQITSAVLSGLSQTFHDEAAFRQSLQKQWHQTFNWQAEDYFTDPKVVELCRAIEKEDFAIVDKLIAEGADANAKGKDNMTPLLWAFPKNNLMVFTRLLEAGADPNVQVTSEFGTGKLGFSNENYIVAGSSVMELAAKTDFSGYFKAVMEHGGDPNLVSKAWDMEYTPLHTAIDETGYVDKVENVKLLIDAGADVNALAHTNSVFLRTKTPLNLAISRYKFEVAILLLEAGADWEFMPDNTLMTIVHSVLKLEENFPRWEDNVRNENLRKSYNQLVALLKDKGADFDEAREDLKVLADISAVDISRININSEEYRRGMEQREQLKERIKERHERYEQKRQLKK